APVVIPPGTPPTDELQRLVEMAAVLEPPAALPDLALRPLPAQAEDRAHVQAHWSLVGTTRLTMLQAMAKRGVRQYLRWMINPIAEQQNAANAAITGTLPHLLAADAELRAHIAVLRSMQQ
ncbi:MAG: hypothetical protein HGA65_12545, partial [Oscillochloris sp.]|nr:hypothetical protein [Oscillochloris sp.]